MFGLGPSPQNITPFQPLKAGADTPALDVLWGCPGGGASGEYLPHFHQLMLHPCAADDGAPGSCCGQDTAPAHVAFESWFRLSDVSLSLTYDVQPDCGDGLTVTRELDYCCFAALRAVSLPQSQPHELLPCSDARPWAARYFSAQQVIPARQLLHTRRDF